MGILTILWIAPASWAAVNRTIQYSSELVIGNEELCYQICFEQGFLRRSCSCVDASVQHCVVLRETNEQHRCRRLPSGGCWSVILESTVKFTTTGGSSWTLDLWVTLDYKSYSSGTVIVRYCARIERYILEDEERAPDLFLLSDLIELICVLCLEWCRRDSLFAW